MMPCLADWLGSAGSFYLKPPTGNLGTRTAIRTTVRPQLAHGRDSQSRPNLSYRRLEVLAKFRPLAARGSAQLLNLVQLYALIFAKTREDFGALTFIWAQKWPYTAWS